MRVEGGWSRLWLSPDSTARTLTLAVGFFVLALLRRPAALAYPTFWNEDGRVFFAGAQVGVGLLAPYQGYLHLVPRFTAFVEVHSLAPALVGNFVALAITALVATFIGSDRIAGAIPSRSARWMLAALIVLAPASDELLGSITYAQWYLALFLVWSVVARPLEGRGRLGEWCALVVAGLTGPFSIILAPLFWLKRDRLAASAVTLAAIAQVATLITSPRLGLLHIPEGLVEILARRAVIEPLVGPSLTLQVPMAVAIPASVLALISLYSLPREVVIGAALVMAVGLLFSFETTDQLLDPYGAERYFFIWGTVVAGAAAISAASGKWSGRLLALPLVVGIVFGFRLPPHGTSLP